MEQQIANQMFEQDGNDIWLCRPYSKYDRNFKPILGSQLQKIPYKQTQNQVKDQENTQQSSYDLNEFLRWIDQFCSTDILYVDNLDKIPLLLNSLRARKCKKVLYVMTSNIPVQSKKYRKLLESLKGLKQENLEIAIISNDLVCRQLGLVRNRKLKRWEQPEIRLVYMDKYVSTQEKEVVEVEGKQVERYKIIEKGNIEHDYWLKYSYSNAFEFTQEKLQEFLDKAEAGQLEHYYENTQDYGKHTIRIEGRKLNSLILENKKITVLEIFGKYCPGCRAIKKQVEGVAQEMKEKLGVQVYRICCDTDYTPELRGMKPFTPVFWVFQPENKPQMFDGKVEDLFQFVEKIVKNEKEAQKSK